MGDRRAQPPVSRFASCAERLPLTGDDGHRPRIWTRTASIRVTRHIVGYVARAFRADADLQIDGRWQMLTANSWLPFPLNLFPNGQDTKLALGESHCSAVVAASCCPTSERCRPTLMAVGVFSAGQSYRWRAHPVLFLFFNEYDMKRRSWSSGGSRSGPEQQQWCSIEKQRNTAWKGCCLCIIPPLKPFLSKGSRGLKLQWRCEH